ncbi:NHL repeat-containing protein, partial [Deinococcus sp.]|uniref:NHL repeat-containing protein n=1 Tax=Deinococcus sp. TaxID=47478 RepID=UPI00391CF42B
HHPTRPGGGAPGAPPTTPTQAAQPATPTTLLGGVELPVSTAALSGQALTFREADVQITRLGAASVQSAGGFDYVRAQYEVKNIGTTPFDNLTLVAVAKQGNVGGTAIKSITSFGGVTSTDQASLAVQSTALHSVTVGTGGALSLVNGATDFQAFTPAEVATLTSQKEFGWNTMYGPGDKPLNYGFTVSKCTTTCTRTLNAGETGKVNVVLRIPKGGATGTAYNFTLNFALVNDSVARVTRSVTPAETAAQASDRLTGLGVATGGEVVSIGGAAAAPVTGRTGVLVSGVDGTRPGIISTVVGTGIPTSSGDGSGDGGPAIYASTDSAVALVFDRSGNLYIAEQRGSRVRKVTPDGIITTFAGTGTLSSTGDGGPATAASLQSPSGLAVDSNNNLYIAESSGHRVRKVAPDGTITTFAGTGTATSTGDGGPATAATLQSPIGLAVDSNNNLYIAERSGYRVRKVAPDGIITTFAGTGTLGSTGDGGPATAATMRSPAGLAVDSDNNLYIAESGGHRVRKVAPDGIITTFAGTGTYSSTGDGGPATAATMRSPEGLAVDSNNNLYMAERDGHRVRKVAPDGIITTLAGTGTAGLSGDGGPATAAQHASPSGVAIDRHGNVYATYSFVDNDTELLTEGVRKITTP